MTSWVYIESEHNLWTVGFYDPKGNWHPDSDHGTKEAAAERVHYMNGGVKWQQKQVVSILSD